MTTSARPALSARGTSPKPAARGQPKYFCSCREIPASSIQHPMNKQTTRREFLSATGTVIAGGAALAASTVPALGQKPATPAIASRRPALGETDVLVVGGGPAGIGAALGAARKGAKTLLIENHSFFGGAATWSTSVPRTQSSRAIALRAWLSPPRQACKPFARESWWIAPVTPT